MIQFFASALLLGTLGGAAVGFSKYGHGKVRSAATGWAIWLCTVAALFSATYAMSIPVYAHRITEKQLYLGLVLAGFTYVVALLAMRYWLKQARSSKE